MKKLYQKVISVLTAVACLFVGGSVGFLQKNLPEWQMIAAASGETLSINSVELTLDELKAANYTVTLTASISGNNNGIRGIGFGFQHDSRLTLKGYHATGILTSVKYNEGSGYNPAIQVLWLGYGVRDNALTGEAVYATGDGGLYSITLQVPTDAQPGDEYTLVALDKDPAYGDPAYLITSAGNVNLNTTTGYIRIKADTTTTTTTTTTKPTTTTTTTTTTATTTTTTTTKPTTTTTTTTTTKLTTTTTTVMTIITTTTTTTEANQFIPGADNWSFLNSDSNFGYGNYFILDSYYDKLVNGLNYIERSYVDDLLQSSWDGSCYGMAVTSILAANDIMNPSDWQANANFLSDIDAPPSEEVKSLINYYMAVQKTDAIQYQTNSFLYLTEKEKLQILVDCLSDGSPTLLTFFGPYWGHAVVAYDLQYGTYSINGNAYNGKVLIYDNNDGTFSDNYCLYFNSSKGTWYIPEYYDAYKLGFITDYISFINYHGYIDNSNTPIQSVANSFIATLQSDLLKSDYSLTKINLNSDKNTYTFSATDSDEIRIFSDFSDNMEANNLKFAMKDAEKGYALKLATAESLDLSMRYENSKYDITASNSNIAVFDPSGYVSVEGMDTDYTFEIIYNAGYHITDWYSFQVEGNSVDSAILKKAENGYLLHADNLQNVSASAHNDNFTAEVTFTTDYTDVLLYEIDEKTIGVAVDTDGDGTYETTIAQSSSEKSEIVTYGDVNMNGVVDLTDVITINKHLANIIQLSSAQEANADCYLDHTVDDEDANTLLQYVILLIDQIPVQG
ncbi:MAG: dockerin type I repeat-containing protein [Ruminococcus sp.]